MDDAAVRTKRRVSWNDTRRTAIRAADGRCESCGWRLSNGDPSLLHVHHVVHRSVGGNDRLKNLCVLCPTCHAIAHDSRTRAMCKSADKAALLRQVSFTACDGQGVRKRLVGRMFITITPKDVVFTEETPKKAGLYLWRYGEDDPELVHVIHHGKGLSVRRASRDSQGREMNVNGAEWAGPFAMTDLFRFKTQEAIQC